VNPAAGRGVGGGGDAASWRGDGFGVGSGGRSARAAVRVRGFVARWRVRRRRDGRCCGSFATRCAGRAGPLAGRTAVGAGVTLDSATPRAGSGLVEVFVPTASTPAAAMSTTLSTVVAVRPCGRTTRGSIAIAWSRWTSSPGRDPIEGSSRPVAVLVHGVLLTPLLADRREDSPGTDLWISCRVVGVDRDYAIQAPRRHPDVRRVAGGLL
jgi:hypothetical protein